MPTVMLTRETAHSARLTQNQRCNAGDKLMATLAPRHGSMLKSRARAPPPRHSAYGQCKFVAIRAITESNRLGTRRLPSQAARNLQRPWQVVMPPAPFESRNSDADSRRAIEVRSIGSTRAETIYAQEDPIEHGFN